MNMHTYIVAEIIMPISIVSDINSYSRVTHYISLSSHIL